MPADPYTINQNSAREGVVRVDSLFTRVDGSGGVTHETDNVRRVAQPMMREYERPKPPPRWEPAEGKQLCAFDECRAYPMKDTGYCAGHTRSLGLRDWPRGGRQKQEPADEAE